MALSGSVAAGDLLIIGVNWGNNVSGTVFTITDNAAGCTNTWTVFPSVQITQAGFNDLTAFWAINCGTQAGGLTVTATITNAGSHGMRLGLYEYNSTTGWPASPVDQGTSTHNSSSVFTGNAGNITPTVSGTLIWSAIELVTSGATAFTLTNCTERVTSGGVAGAGWTNDNRADGADVQNGTTSAQTCTWNWSSVAGGFSALIANFKPNSGSAFTASVTVTLTESDSVSIGAGRFAKLTESASYIDRPSPSDVHIITGWHTALNVRILSATNQKSNFAIARIVQHSCLSCGNEVSIYEHCAALPCFNAAMPSRGPPRSRA